MLIIVIVIQKEVAGSAREEVAPMARVRPYGTATGQTLGVRSRPTTEEEVNKYDIISLS